MGTLLLILGCALLTPIPWSLADGEGHWSAFAGAAALAGGLGGLLHWRTRQARGASAELRRRDALLLVSLAWVAAAIVGAVPYLLTGTLGSFTDAVFESMSGFTTTGATVLTDIEVVSRSVLFWRALTHWLGGMGIMVLLVAVLASFGVGGMQVLRAESPGPSVERLTSRVRETAAILWLLYVGLTGAQVILYMVLGMSLFDALAHAFATMATGGFSTRNASLAAFSPAIQWVTVLFMFLAGTNFSLLVLAGRARRPGPLVRNPEFRVYLGVTLTGIAIIAAILWRRTGAGWEEGLRHAAFQVVSIITTTGFATQDFNLWPSFAHGTLLLLFLAGACAGSTGGGIKMFRYLVLAKQTLVELTRALHPRAVLQVRIGDRPLPDELVSSTQQFFALYVGALGLGLFVLTGTGLDTESAYTAAAATLGNIGPGLGSVGPAANYAHLPPLGKWTTTFLMLIGRLELYTVLALFSRVFWRR